ncbi:hypothetical protein STANM309S_06663 [Streptomyces tanashiensis]
MFADSKPLGGGWLKNQYNPSGVNGSGFDPMNSMLEALGHSPEAAKEHRGAHVLQQGRQRRRDRGPGPEKDGAQKGYLDYFQNKDYEFSTSKATTRTTGRRPRSTCRTPSATPWRRRPRPRLAPPARSCTATRSPPRS